MSTKVKGEVIKEGSIPMSALSTEVKDKIENAGSGSGGADWNAQEGEAGYIENKPFGVVDFNSVEWFYDDAASWCITPMVSNKAKYEGVIYEIPDNYDEPVNLGDGSIALARYYSLSDNLIYVSCYGITESTDERLQNILFEVNTKLDEQYLPDTVIKTTPQELSDYGKNQALANLGIDPVVWKYMCEPYIIDEDQSEGTIPEELVSIIFKDNGHLHPIVQNLIVFNTGPILKWVRNELFGPEGEDIVIETDGSWYNM